MHPWADIPMLAFWKEGEETQSVARGGPTNHFIATGPVCRVRAASAYTLGRVNFGRRMPKTHTHTIQ